MAATRTFLQAAQDTANGSTYTFSSQNFGAADAGRYIVCCFQSRAGSGSPIVTSVTIGGVSASIAVQRASTSDGRTLCCIAVAAVPTGASGNVVVVVDTSMVRAEIQLYRVLGISGVTAADVDSSIANSPSVSLDIPAGGIGIGCAGFNGLTTCTWAGLTEDSDQQIESNQTDSSASGEFATQQSGLTITCTPIAANSSCGVFASWGPAATGNSQYYSQMQAAVCA